MAFDNPDREKPEACEYKAALERVLAEIDKLRQDMAPLLEKHQREENERLEQERRHQALMEEHRRLMKQYSSVSNFTMDDPRCDCTPDRSSMLNRLGRHLTNFISD